MRHPVLSSEPVWEAHPSTRTVSVHRRRCPCRVCAPRSGREIPAAPTSPTASLPQPSVFWSVQYVWDPFWETKQINMAFCGQRAYRLQGCFPFTQLSFSSKLTSPRELVSPANAFRAFSLPFFPHQRFLWEAFESETVKSQIRKRQSSKFMFSLLKKEPRFPGALALPTSEI